MVMSWLLKKGSKDEKCILEKQKHHSVPTTKLPVNIHKEYPKCPKSLVRKSWYCPQVVALFCISSHVLPLFCVNERSHAKITIFTPVPEGKTCCFSHILKRTPNVLPKGRILLLRYFCQLLNWKMFPLVRVAGWERHTANRNENISTPCTK